MLIKTPLLHQSFGPRVCLSFSLSILIPWSAEAGCVTQGILASLLLSLTHHRLQTTRFWSIKGPTIPIISFSLDKEAKSGSVIKSLSHVWLFVTPWTVARQAPLSMEFFRQEYLSGLLFPSPGGLPDPGIKPWSPALQADSLPSEPPGKPLDNDPIIFNRAYEHLDSWLSFSAFLALGCDYFVQIMPVGCK